MKDQTPLQALEAEINATSEKIQEAAADVAAADAAYKAALNADNEAEALAQLERKEAAERRHTLHSDRLPLLEERRPEAVRRAAEPEIRQRCIELQEKCDHERGLIESYHRLAGELHSVALELLDVTHAVGAELANLKTDIKKAGGPYHPAVERTHFAGMKEVIGRMMYYSYNNISERGLTEHREYTPAELEARRARWEKQSREIGERIRAEKAAAAAAEEAQA